MGTFLFNELVFGPVSSRRLGNSLGINLLPINKKICNFNCIYCECGLTDNVDALNGGNLPTVEELFSTLENKIRQCSRDQIIIDTITFAGNGEPTLHPDFSEIIDRLIDFRDKKMPEIKIAVLSNASRITNKHIRESLKKTEFNILKLDSVFSSTVQRINCPSSNYDLDEIIRTMKTFKGNLIIQTMFFRGHYKGLTFDNTSEKELTPLLEAYTDINPQMVMIYTIARDTPFNTLYKIPEDELRTIADRIKELGISVQLSA